MIKEQGKPVGFQVVAHDTTKRKQTEETLRMYESIVSTTRDFISFIDRDYIYQAINEAHCKAHGKSGEEIILEARILGVADVVEAMASHRPYRQSLGLAQSLDEISQNKGTLYDPKIVDACLKLFTKNGFNLE